MEFAWHFLRVGGVSALAAGDVVSKRHIQREGRWESDAYKVNTRNKADDASQASSNFAKEGMESPREPGQNTVWGKPQL